MSTASTLLDRSTRAQPRLMTVVVLPVPPFPEIAAMVTVTAVILGSRPYGGNQRCERAEIRSRPTTTTMTMAARIPGHPPQPDTGVNLAALMGADTELVRP